MDKETRTYIDRFINYVADTLACLQIDHFPSDLVLEVSPGDFELMKAAFAERIELLDRSTLAFYQFYGTDVETNSGISQGDFRFAQRFRTHLTPPKTAQEDNAE